MSESTRLQLPYLAGGQAQKHITVNESLLRLDALVQLSVKSATTAAQPGSPSDGDIYLLPSGKTGAAWGAMANGALAYYRDGTWEELTPRHGWQAYAEDADALYARDAGVWNRIAAKEEHRLIFTPGGDGVVSIYRIDTARVQNPRTATISSVASDVITLSTADAGLFFNNTMMSGVCYARIWNTSKTPNQSAWVKASGASNQLTVLDAAAISTWTASETIQIGDPTTVTPNRVIALDISPMMQTVLGRVFRQKGVLVKAQVEGTVSSAIEISETGAAGSFSAVRSESTGGSLAGQMTAPCSVASPISDSNLVFIREKTTGSGLGVTILSAMGLWV